MLSLRKNSVAANIKSLLDFQRFNHIFVKGEHLDELYAHMGSDKIKLSKWEKLDSRKYGLNVSRIPQSPWIVLKILQKAGFEAYLVGGCVRDLLLNRIPKDFDVITTAALRQVKKQFHNSIIVGRRFPICQVNIKGCMIEVSSFDTVAKHQSDKDDFAVSKLPKGCDEKDFNRWKNCMHRDFTVNSLFYDPFTNKIYDYVDARSDIMMSKLRTLKPAQLSFEEDCARILRGLRLAARLGLSFSKEIEIAIHKLSPSILDLNKARVMMEVNYMLAYGAAEPSLSLLNRFHLVEILLPVQAAYLTEQSREGSNQSSFMLMKLFSNLDRLVSCDRPAESTLWVTMLAFHLALIRDPPEALIVLTFGSILYHGNWMRGVKFARDHAQELHSYVPEMSNYKYSFSDYELAEKVTRLALHVQKSVLTFTETEALLEEMEKFPEFPKSGNVFVPKKYATVVAQLVEVLVADVTDFNKPRKSFEIRYDLLHRGIHQELRFVLGKIILYTMGIRLISDEKPGSPVLDYQKGLDGVAKNQHSVDVKKGNALNKSGKKRTADHKEELVVGKKQKLGEKNSRAEKIQDSMKDFCFGEKNSRAEKKQDSMKDSAFAVATNKHKKAISEGIGCLLKDYASKTPKRDEIQPLLKTLKVEPKSKPVDGKESKHSPKRQKDTIDDSGTEKHEPANGKRKDKTVKVEPKSKPVDGKASKHSPERQKDTIDDSGTEKHEPANGKRKDKSVKVEPKSKPVDGKASKHSPERQKDTIDDSGAEKHKPANGKRKDKARKLSRLFK